ncbi:serine/threonine-protein kinase RsbW [Reichenbachiella faecimaris]|uniref:Serine/threonine-protein kinase RsbW n=1 Tax=Reichenbachiella faecimaris TaxID=692418 RepID=A0A1W2GET7_REIFA|nr:ATP-binding protein [Reichenbachiella faecimaris]SMD35024.1 serine/threonine-protein kinase RsbW [Reichenbachiella faecimaris]
MHQFKTNCKRERLKEIRHFVAEVLTDIGLSEIDAHKVILAVDEVCANLIIHSNKCNPSECLELFIEDHGKDGVLFEIIDYGIGFNYNNYKEPNLEEIIRKRKKGGLGIMLVKNIMDTVEFKNEENKNICRMIKKFTKNK